MGRALDSFDHGGRFTRSRSGNGAEVFRDRTHAGRLLAEAVVEALLTRPLVLALPRGGVPVAVPVARRVGALLDVVVARKLGAPGRPEMAVGAIAEGGAEVVDPVIVDRLAVGRGHLADVAARERRELARRVEAYRGGRPLPALDGDVVVVDDGLATGATAEAALRGLRALGAARLVLAVPVGAPDTVERLRAVADEVVCLATPDPMWAVGQWYDRFDQVSDREVLRLLDDARRSAPPPADLGSGE